MRRREFLAMAALSAGAQTKYRPEVIAVPHGGIQPQVAVGRDGVVNLLYFAGDPRRGDLYVVRSSDEGRTFSEPVRVNRDGQSAIAVGTIRGGQIAVGRNGRVHVAWNGTQGAKTGPPLLYARLAESGTEFEPERNLMTKTTGLDGGGSIAADADGRVLVGWHGFGDRETEGEGGRQVFLARSEDDGETFGVEGPVWGRPTGACGCCGMKVFVSRRGQVYLMYRSATAGVHRDVYLLGAARGKVDFTGAVLQKWDINACPMSSMSFAEGVGGVYASWETDGQVYFARVGEAGGPAGRMVPAVVTPGKRKHSYVAVNRDGQVLMIWVEGSGWQKGGRLCGRLFDARGRAMPEVLELGECPTWSMGAVFARKDGSFVVVNG